MAGYVKTFESFSNNDDSINEFDFDLGKILGGAVDFFGPGLGDAAKIKLTKFLLQKIGIIDSPDSPLALIVQEVVAAIPVADYPGIFSGENFNMRYFAPKLADATVNYIKVNGIDGILNPLAEKFGVDRNGWLYTTVVRSIVDSMQDETQFKKKVSDLFAFLGGLEISSSEYLDTLSQEEQKGVSKGLYSTLSKYDPNKAKEILKSTGASRAVIGADDAPSKGGFGDVIGDLATALTRGGTGVTDAY
jgi:hypothetical protein